MDQVVRLVAFLLALIVGRYLAEAATFSFEWGEPILDPSLLFSPWIAFVSAIAGGATYLIAMVWLRGRSVWLTALVSALVATLLYLPSLLPLGKTPSPGLFLLSVFVQWFAIGALGHVAAVLASRRFSASRA